MTPDELRTALDRLGMTQAAFAQYIGVHRLTVQGWITGRYPVPRYVEVVIELSDLIQRLEAILKRAE